MKYRVYWSIVSLEMAWTVPSNRGSVPFYFFCSSSFFRQILSPLRHSCTDRSEVDLSITQSSLIHHPILSLIPSFIHWTTASGLSIFPPLLLPFTNLSIHPSIHQVNLSPIHSTLRKSSQQPSFLFLLLIFLILPYPSSIKLFINICISLHTKLTSSWSYGLPELCTVAPSHSPDLFLLPPLEDNPFSAAKKKWALI